MAWQKVASLNALRDGGGTHAHALLADGFVEGDTIECPLHQAQFEIRTGKALCGPATEDLKIYPVKVEGGDVLINLERSASAREPVPADHSSASVAASSNGGPDRAGNGGTESRTTDGHLFSKQYVWPGDDLTVIPDWVYTDQEIYRREVERIFHGPTWNYVALEAEVEKPGDFIRSNVGPTPVVVARADDGSINVFENRCMHRAAEFCRELSGTAKEFVCPYHQWTYDLKGNLIGVPFRRGVGGKGGMPADFRNEDHGIRQLNV